MVIYLLNTTLFSQSFFLPNTLSLPKNSPFPQFNLLYQMVGIRIMFFCFIGKSKRVKRIFSRLQWHLVYLALRCLVFWVGFQLSPSKKDLYTAFDGTENRQKRPRNAQVSMPPLKVWRWRVGIPGNFRVLKVRITEVAEGGDGIG